jgi:large subunit ribosomal protein L24
MRRIKKNDNVVVVAGRDKGKQGKVLRVLADGDRIVVEKVNLVKKHQKPTQNHPQGGIIEMEASLHASNVMPVGSNGDGFRVSFKRVDGGESGTRSVRVNARTGEELE